MIALLLAALVRIIPIDGHPVRLVWGEGASEAVATCERIGRVSVGYYDERINDAQVDEMLARRAIQKGGDTVRITGRWMWGRQRIGAKGRAYRCR